MSHLKDPTTQYYTGEYPKQKQPTPGIQAKMTPVPDCGEKTYVGSGRLKDPLAVKRGIVALLSWCFFKQSISTYFCPVFRHSVSQTTGYALANR